MVLRLPSASLILGAVLLSLSPGAGLAAAPPQRIVSMNLCTDQLVLMLAEPGSVVSVSWLTADHRESPMAEAAEGLILNHGLAEEILPLEPDLVISGALTTRFTVGLLRRLGYRVLELKQATSLGQIRRNIRLLAEAIRREEKGTAVLAEMDRALAAIRPRQRTFEPRALVFRPGGYTVGTNTLVHDILLEAGLQNTAAALGIDGWGQVSVEDILGMQPDVVIIDSYRVDEPSLANRLLEHPALKQVFEETPVISVPGEWWSCGTPFVVNAAEALHEVGRAWMANPGQ